MAKEEYSELMKSLNENQLTLTGELEPVKTTNLHETLEGAKLLKGHVVAANVTDNPTAFAYMNALVPCHIIQRDIGLETVYQVTVRDRNRLALVSDLLAASALGIKNVLALSGDHTVVGDNPGAKPVYDLDSAGLVYLLRRMMDGVDLKGNKIDQPPKFCVGMAANPNADPLEPEILKIERKVKLGAHFVQTQAVYDVELARKFMDAISYLKIPVLMGIAPFKSISMLDWMVKFVPGILVPQEIQDSLRKAKARGGKEAVYEENITIFSELLKEMKKTTNVSGFHVMTIGFEWIVPKILERSGITLTKT